MADRRRGFSLAEQLRPLAPLIAVWGTGVAIMALVVAQNIVPDEQLLLDPTYAGGLPWYTGLVSSLGILVWTVAACAAAAGAFAASLGDRRSARHFLLHGAAVGAALLLDDLLQFHSQIGHLIGLPKLVVSLLFPVLAISWIGMHFREVQRGRYQLLLAAGVALAGSFAADALLTNRLEIGIVIEDGLKLLGILAWATYFVTTAHDVARSVAIQLSEMRGNQTPHQLSASADRS